MTRKNLMKTFCPLLLATLGTVWPWISANAQDTLNVSVAFNSTPPVNCVAQFTCPTGSNCQSTTPIRVTPSNITCTSKKTTAPTNRSCTNVAASGTYTYNPSQNTLVSNVSFRRNTCNCIDPIILQSGTAYTASVNRCVGGNTVTSVFPGAPTQTVNVSGTYTIGHPDSPSQP
jgi:hypothetical protein